jgi:tetratricopeptide (TPR) repeat protein
MALLAKDRVAEAEQELATLRALVADPAIKGQTTFSNNSGFAILRIAPEVVAGEIAAKRKDYDRAVMHLERGVRFEDSLVYQEPPDWHVPVRQNLAGVLLAAGRADEAETVLWEDLKRNPEHGWNLMLLARVLRAQDKDATAAQIEARLAKSWKEADATATYAARRER